MRLRTLGGLWIQNDQPVAPLGARRMALLALVASAGKRGISRERVAGILWGEAGEENARHTLSQNLYTLRRETGRDWITGSPKLCLNSGATSDIGDFLEAVEAEDHHRVAELYTGTFLLDFQLSGAPEFERWVEEERSTLRRSALRSMEILAGRAGAEGKLPEASAWWRRLTELDGLNGRYAHGLIRSLADSGDLVAALAHARVHSDMVRRELETDVDPSLRALIATLRHQVGKRLTLTPPDETVETDKSDGLIVSSNHRLKDASSRSRLAATAMLVIPALIALAAILFDRLRLSSTAFDHGAATLAVGTIRSTDSAAPSAVLRDMLATSLGGIGDLSIVANSRLLELMPAGADTVASAIADAARRAGANEVFEGEMVAVTGGFRLNLRRVNLKTGVVQHGYALHAGDPAAVIDSAAAAIARDLGVGTPTRSVATTRTASPAAYALYQRGLQSYYRGYAIQAHELMRGAFELDSTFAMAAYYGWLASIWTPQDRDADLLEHARRLAPRTIDRERLLIAGAVSRWDSSVVTSVAIAETLAVRYPQDPEGLVLLGEALENQGDFARAIAAFERAVALDSATNASAGPFCRVCYVLAGEVRTYLWWDSLDAAVRTARRSRAFRPSEASGLHDLVEPLLRLGRRPEALRALAQRESLTTPDALARILLRRDMIRQGDFEEVDQQLIADLGHPSVDVRGESRWLLLISLRNQGRLREAQALALDRLIPGTTKTANIEPEVMHQALLAVETGDPGRAARMFRETADQVGRKDLPLALRARRISWNLTLAGTALATIGDTAGVRRLTDSVERMGGLSNFGRDPRLHHYLRGLILQRGGKHAEAVAEFRRALHSVTDGYTRINYELARCLLQLGQAREAIAVLQPALRGGVDGSNTYITHTELHETLAQAFAAAGLRDSSRVHYGAVERAWRRADSRFAERYEVAKAKSAGP